MTGNIIRNIPLFYPVRGNNQGGKTGAVAFEYFLQSR